MKTKRIHTSHLRGHRSHDRLLRRCRSVPIRGGGSRPDHARIGELHGAPAVGVIQAGSLSANGRYVVFSSMATNLVAVVSGLQVYRHDRSTGVTALVSVSKTGTPSTAGGFAASVSADGRFVAFASAGNDFVNGDTNNADRHLPARHGRGHHGDGQRDPNGCAGRPGRPREQRRRQARDLGRRTLRRLRVDRDEPRPDVEQRQVAGLREGHADRPRHARVRRRDERRGRRRQLRPRALRQRAGRGLPLAGRELLTSFDLTHRAALRARPRGGYDDPRVRHDGRRARAAAACHRGGAVLRWTLHRLRVEGASSIGRDKDIGTLDVFLRDRALHTTVLASLSSLAVAGADSRGPSISADGRWVGFQSLDDKLVTGDANGMQDVFVYDRTTRGRHARLAERRRPAGQRAQLRRVGLVRRPLRGADVCGIEPRDVADEHRPAAVRT